ncbi:hypothetical protein [Kangiella sp. TOML190]|uniref:hypothetical protein n=1 Tax=Kangiella sp. TOML190 TaxID=2931351 RepID=UPI00203E3D20|nr:hypothetical protein [Kangiella sp. TOML190]
MKKFLFGLAIAAVGLSLSANDKLSYNYVQFGLIHSAGELTSDKSGYNFDISLEWTDSIYWRTRYNTQSADVWAAGQKADVDASEFGLSLGYHGAMTRSSDFFAELGYIRQDATDVIPQSTYGNDEDGFIGTLGVRTRWAADWESSIYASYRDIDISDYVDEARYEDDDTSYGIEVRYSLSPSWSLGLSIGEEATGDTSQLNIRFSF